jgi:hypothetical protein
MQWVKEDNKNTFYFHLVATLQKNEKKYNTYSSEKSSAIY